MGKAAWRYSAIGSRVAYPGRSGPLMAMAGPPLVTKITGNGRRRYLFALHCTKVHHVQLTLRTIAVTIKLLIQLKIFQHHVDPRYSAYNIYISAVGPKNKSY